MISSNGECTYKLVYNIQYKLLNGYILYYIFTSISKLNQLNPYLLEVYAWELPELEIVVEVFPHWCYTYEKSDACP